MKAITNVLFSFKTTLILLAILAIGAGVATFIENDYGTSTARVLVYNHIWYETALVLTTINLMGVIIKFKMWKNKPRFIFHFAFVVILIGAAVTRYIGYEGIVHIREGQTQNRMISLEPYLQVKIKQKDASYYKEYQHEFAASSLRKGIEGNTESNGIVSSLGQIVNNFNHDISFNGRNLNIEYVSYLVSKKGQAEMGILTVNVTLDGETRTVRLPGKRGQPGVEKIEGFKDTVVTLEYGSKVLELPFAIKLNDFQLDRYPGSMAPSSYASEVTVLKDNKAYDYRIFMNRTLHEGNFLFFQSSYDQDELGTVLSVNNDPGKWPTYLGYFLLTLGLILNLFDKKSRFWKLTKYVSSKNVAALITALLFTFSSQNLLAQEQEEANTSALNMQVSKEEISAYLDRFKKDSIQTAENFSKIVVQSNGGRMKPLNTLNHDILSKLSGKSTLFGMNSDQIVLGMLTRPEIWRHIAMVKIKTPKLKKILGIDQDSKYISFSQVFKDGEYILTEYAQKAARLSPNQRGTFEKDIIKLDEKLNIAYMVYNGMLFKMFPQTNADDNNKWYSPLDAMRVFQGDNQKAIESLVRGFVNAIISEDWEMSNKFIDMIVKYQSQVGAEIMPSKSDINNEIMFNKLNIFPKLTLAYLFLGFIILIAAFIVVFNPKIKPRKTTLFFFIILGLLFAAHTFGMGFRWIVSGHAPWSDTYESLLYISWSAVFAAVIFFRKSLLALSAGVIVAAIFMFTAHLTSIDPQITNLVPVLKSYWLTIHVSVLTASYGFFGLGAILGFIALVLFIFRKNRPHLDETIKHITAINEIALIVGLSAITIGNFLGGVWANESWGRYWGWDPKETWAYVSIVIYVLVVHLRFVKALNNPFVFSVASLLSFSSILMTYFGVNFYLSGLHSYATGDPVPIPMWVYYVTAAVFVTIALAYKNHNLKDSIKVTK